MPCNSIASLSTVMGKPPAHLHIALNVQDLDRSVAFYRAVFGIHPDKRKPRFARFTTRRPPLVLSLNERRKVKPGNALAHLGLRLGSPEDYIEAKRRLEDLGLVTREQERVHCCHAIENKVWVSDPDGNEWEFYELVDDLQGPDAAQRTAEAGGACG